MRQNQKPEEYNCRVNIITNLESKQRELLIKKMGASKYGTSPVDYDKKFGHIDEFAYFRYPDSKENININFALRIHFSKTMKGYTPTPQVPLLFIKKPKALSEEEEEELFFNKAEKKNQSAVSPTILNYDAESGLLANSEGAPAHLLPRLIAIHEQHIMYLKLRDIKNYLADNPTQFVTSLHQLLSSREDIHKFLWAIGSNESFQSALDYSSPPHPVHLYYTPVELNPILIILNEMYTLATKPESKTKFAEFKAQVDNLKSLVETWATKVAKENDAIAQLGLQNIHDKFPPNFPSGVTGFFASKLPLANYQDFINALSQTLPVKKFAELMAQISVDRRKQLLPDTSGRHPDCIKAILATLQGYRAEKHPLKQKLEDQVKTAGQEIERVRNAEIVPGAINELQLVALKKTFTAVPNNGKNLECFQPFVAQLKTIVKKDNFKRLMAKIPVATREVLLPKASDQHPLAIKKLLSSLEAYAGEKIPLTLNELQQRFNTFDVALSAQQQQTSTASSSSRMWQQPQTLKTATGDTRTKLQALEEEEMETSLNLGL